MSLLIEQMIEEAKGGVTKTAEEVEMEKMAEEVAMEKVASDLESLDQANVLFSIGEGLNKLASDNEAGDFYRAMGDDAIIMSGRIGACLAKTAASTDGSALGEALDIADDLCKLASVFADIADNDPEASQHPEFMKMAEVIVDIAVTNKLEAEEILKEASEAMAAEEEAIAKEAGMGVNSPLPKGKLKAAAEWLANQGRQAGARAKNVYENTSPAVAAAAAAGAAAAAVGGTAAYKHYKKKNS